MAYTNSPMVAYTKLSPNHSGQRTHCIDRITPHCVVGQCTAEGLGEWFEKTSTQASSNYGIDKNGRVGMYVEEKNRSWCTSSNANDQRAVTIECASGTTEPYEMYDVVYQTLIKLCTDICKRNGKKKLLWLKDKDKTLNYTPAADEMIITVHRWFANKSCPGEWLFSRLGDLANKVTAALGETAPAPVKDTGNGEMTDEEIYAYFKAQGLNDYGIAGLMGNLYAESAMRSNNLQNTYEKSLGMTDASYTAAVDNGSYTNFVHDSAGYGLAQWTYWSRKQTLLNYAREKGVSISNKRMQCECIMKELKESYPTVLNTLKNATSVRTASDDVLKHFEAPADVGTKVQETRAGYGQKYFDLYAGKPAADTPAPVDEYPAKLTDGWYRVRKTWADKKSQIGAYKILANAKNAADANPGFHVFTEDGVSIYPATEYRVHTVVKGDTLWGIAAKYLGSGIRYKEIVQLNGLKSDVIYVGNKLKIPN